MGLLKMSAAMKPESRKETKESARPKITSKIKPAHRMLLTRSGFSSALYCAVYLTMAEFMPQSRNVPIKIGAANAIVYKP